LFVSRDVAMRYMRSEMGPRPQTVILVAGVLGLEMNRKPTAAAWSAWSAVHILFL
jgi:hypothetical protein